ncbi:MAG: DNA internalization-related competence protein ComEC/Rec2 [Desulfobacterales bacterium]
MPTPVYPRPVVPLLIALIAGIVAGTWFPGFPLPVSLVAVVSIGSVGFALFRGRTGGMSPLILMTALGYLSIQPWIAPQFPAHHVIHYADRQMREITGSIATPPISANHRVRFVLQAETLRDEKSRPAIPVTGKIRVTLSTYADKPTPHAGSTGQQRWSMGDRLVFSGRIKRLRNFHNPGGFDYERFMAFQSLWTSTSVRSDRMISHTRPPVKGIRSRVEAMRRRIVDFIRASDFLIGQDEEKAVLRALVVGDRSAISRDLRQAFNRSGTGHLLAISGLHVGIVATVAFFCFQWVLSFARPLLWRAWTRKGAAILTFFPVLCYGLMAGMSPSTQRAVIMVTVFLMTFVFEREHDPINTLGLAAMAILIVYPPAFFSISFQLSFGAVLSILYGLSKIPTRWTVYRDKGKTSWLIRLGAKGAAFLWVSLFAIAGTLPLVMVYFNQVSLIGVFSNCLMVPLVGFLVVPLGLSSVVAYPLWGYGATLLLNASAAVLTVAIGITHWLSNLPFAAIKTITPNLLELSCYYVLAWAMLNLRDTQRVTSTTGDTLPSAGYTTPGRGRWLINTVMKRWQRLRVGGNRVRILALVVIVVMVLDGCYWYNKRFGREDLGITIIDVGQGTAAFLELPGGACFLIDGGGFSDNTVFDVGERIIAPLLWRKKIMTVDTLVLSHPNSDHLNGLLYIAEHFNVRELWANDDVADTVGYKRFAAAVKHHNIRRPQFTELSRLQNINGVTFQILYPPDRKSHEGYRGPRQDTNNNSLVLKVSFGNHSFLFPGDIMARGEKELVSLQGDALKSTVLLSPHHGSRSSSSARFLDRVAPEIVLISSGWKNWFGFPHASVLKDYQARGYRLFNTAEDGAIRVSTNGHDLEIKTTIY